MSAHTPGPWEVVEIKHEKIISNWVIRIGEYEISVFPYKYIYSKDKTQVALISDDQKLADTRLIAAAPDLLEALEACNEAMAYMSEYDIPLCLPDKVKAAIAKAKGKM